MDIALGGPVVDMALGDPEMDVALGGPEVSVALASPPAPHVSLCVEAKRGRCAGNPMEFLQLMGTFWCSVAARTRADEHSVFCAPVRHIPTPPRTCRCPVGQPQHPAGASSLLCMSRPCSGDYKVDGGASGYGDISAETLEAGGEGRSILQIRKGKEGIPLNKELPGGGITCPRG